MSNEPSTVSKAVKHVKKHKKLYAVAALTGGAYYLGVRNGSVIAAHTIDSGAVETIKNVAVDQYISSFYKAGRVPLSMDFPDYQLFVDAMSKAGRLTTELAEDSLGDALALIDYYKPA